jgi:hypothetical protein
LSEGKASLKVCRIDSFTRRIRPDIALHSSGFER